MVMTPQGVTDKFMVLIGRSLAHLVVVVVRCKPGVLDGLSGLHLCTDAEGRTSWWLRYAVAHKRTS